MDHAEVVTCFLRNRGDVLFLKRSETATTYADAWGAVSGYLEHEDPIETARMEIREETGIQEATLIRAGDPFVLRDEELNREWTIHPFLFAVTTRDIVLNEETTEATWTTPTALLRLDTVPALWSSYERVAPSPETIASDTEHGSAYLSIRALEVLRNTAAETADKNGDCQPISEIAEELLAARPSMAALTNRVNRVMTSITTPEDIESGAISGITRAFEADEDAAATAATIIGKKRVLTLSYSGTVLDALRDTDSDVIVAESRPGLEGVRLAEDLARTGINVTLCTDAALGYVLWDQAIDAVLVGADTVLRDGRVVNKTGTRSASLAAANEEIPFYVVAASDKISTSSDIHLEDGDPTAIYEGSMDVRPINPTFDVTPSEFIDAVLTDRGSIPPEEVDRVAEEFDALSAWRATNQ